jgi:membrane-associated phospholipid phosphatase
MHFAIRGIDASISHLGRRHPPSGASRLLAKAASPWAATVQGLAAAVAVRADGGSWLPVAASAPSAIGAAKLLKKITARNRPGLTRFKRKGKESFPSSHVAGHAAVLASLWCVAPPSKGWRAALAVGAGLSAAIGIERVCASRHWPSDVVAGAALGIGVGLALGRLARRSGPARDAVR